MSEKIEVGLSKKKLLTAVILGAGFVIAGLSFIGLPGLFVNPIISSSTGVVAIGVLTVLFFGLISIYVSRKLLTTEPGLIINNFGIYDNSSVSSGELIPWSDVREIVEHRTFTQRVVLIKVNNAETHIANAPSPWAKRAMRANVLAYGTPIAITSVALDIEYDTLLKTLNTYYLRHRTEDR